MAKREIHNGHDLWAELLGILLSGPNLGMCSRNADWRPAGPFVPTGKGGGRGGGSMAGASLSGGGASHTRGRRRCGMGESRESGACTDRLLELGIE